MQDAIYVSCKCGFSGPDALRVYTQISNRRHGRTGHLFQGRYKAILVDKDAYFLEVSRYVVLNPAWAGMVKQPEKWQ